MKKKKLIIIVIVAFVILLTLGYFFIPKCGPSSGGFPRSQKYCDKSCKLDADCEFKCGCGVVNKNEKCDTGNLLIDCIMLSPNSIKCISNQCVIESDVKTLPNINSFRNLKVDLYFGEVKMITEYINYSPIIKVEDKDLISVEVSESKILKIKPLKEGRTSLTVAFSNNLTDIYEVTIHADRMSIHTKEFLLFLDEEYDEVNLSKYDYCYNVPDSPDIALVGDYYMIDINEIYRNLTQDEEKFNRLKSRFEEKNLSINNIPLMRYSYTYEPCDFFDKALKEINGEEK